jgi:hypothetical protein
MVIFDKNLQALNTLTKQGDQLTTGNALRRLSQDSYVPLVLKGGGTP